MRDLGSEKRAWMDPELDQKSRKGCAPEHASIIMGAGERSQWRCGETAWRPIHPEVGLLLTTEHTHLPRSRYRSRGPGRTGPSTALAKPGRPLPIPST